MDIAQQMKLMKPDYMEAMASEERHIGGLHSTLVSPKGEETQMQVINPQRLAISSSKKKLRNDFE